ncbi:MAG: hypothetical protein SGJ07_16280 [Rhodospirillaceae bacterium]|nr:hypothetical protein [Rhodospirillaceae bacterium]
MVVGCDRAARRAVRCTAWLLLALTIAIVPAATVHAAAPTLVTIELDGRRLALPIPPGYCAIERGTNVDAETYDRFASTFGNGKRVLLWFADCTALGHVADAPASLFLRYGVYLTPCDADGKTETFIGLSRAEFASAMARSLPAFDLEDLVASIRHRWQASLGSPADAAGSEQIGVIGHDEHAYYLAIVDAGVARDRGGLHASIIGGTLLYDRSISVLLSRAVSAADTLHLLRWDTEALVAAMLAANPEGDAAETGWKIDNNRLALWGVKIALLLLAIAIVNLAWKRWCRRRGVAP